MKTCKACQADKPLSAFHRNSSMADGRLSKCKACRSEERRVKEKRDRGYARPGPLAFRNCSRCKVNKSVSEFSLRRGSRRGVAHRCKSCEAAKRKDRIANNTSPKLNVSNKICSTCSKNKPIGLFSKDRHSHDGRCRQCKSCTAEYYRDYRERNRTKLTEYHNNLRWSDPSYALTMRARQQARKVLNGARVTGFFRHMPYTRGEFRDHLMSTLPEGYCPKDACDGNKLHIDHIRPVSSFNLTGEIDDEFYKCWSLDNLQLLPAEENLAKSDTWDGASA